MRFVKKKVYLVISLVFLCVVYSHAQVSNEWNTVKMGGGGFVSAVIGAPAEKNLFYARTDVGGAYRWEENTQKWIPLLDWVSESEKSLLGVESLAIDPQSPNKLYISAGLSGYGWGGASILRSDDYGETFEKIPVDFYIHGNGMGRQTGERLAVDPNDGNIVFCGTRKNGLWKSTNSGENWSRITSFPITSTPNLNAVCFVLFDKNTGSSATPTQTIYAGSSKEGDNMFVSKNGGETWNVIPNAPTINEIKPQRAVLSSNGNLLYVTYANGAGPHAQTWDGVNDPMDKGAVYKFTVSTGIWENISPINLLDGSIWGCYGGLSIDPNNGQKVVCSTINHWGQQQIYTDGSSAWGDRIYVTEDGGKNWKNLFSGSNPMKLDKNGISWISGHNLHWVGSVVLDPFNDKRLFASSGNGIFMTENLSTTETSIMKFCVDGLEETVPLDMVSIPDGPFVSVVGDYDGWIHEDVAQFPTGKRHEPNMGTTTGIAYSPQNKQVLVRAGSSAAVLYYSTDTGKSWKFFNGVPDVFKNGKVAVSTSGNTNIVAWVPEDSSNKMYITTNWGVTWQNIWNNSYASLKGAHPYADPMDPTLFYVYSPSGGKVYKCFFPVHGGNAEVTLLGDIGSGGSPNLAVNTHLSADFWVAVGSAGLKYYQNNSWSSVNNINATAVTLGKEASGTNYPTLYVWGTEGDTNGLFGSTDKGVSWQRINDEAHEYGGLGNAGMILGDNTVFGRVYMSSAGRGIPYVDSENLITSVSQPLNKQNQPFDYFPSPFSEEFTINTYKNFSYSVYSISGALIEKGNLRTGEKLGANWQNGIFVIRLNDGVNNYHFKIIRQGK